MKNFKSFLKEDVPINSGGLSRPGDEENEEDSFMDPTDPIGGRIPIQGVKEFRDGLTEDTIREKFSFMNSSAFENATLGTKNGKLVFYNGTWIDGAFEGIWETGTFKDGSFDGLWKNGDFIDGSFRGTWISGSFKVEHSRWVISKVEPLMMEYLRGIHFQDLSKVEYMSMEYLQMENLLMELLRVELLKVTSKVEHS